jgi:hypothetical protein
MVKISLSPVERSPGGVDILVSSEVWDWRVHWIWGLALILGIVASSG